jgi:hypothetical protein
MSQSNSGKIYFLSGRGRRSSSARALRRKPEPPSQPAAQRGRPTQQETVWLAWALFIEALYLAVLWLAEGTDLFGIEPNPSLRQWLVSFFPAELFVAGVAAFGAYDLRRSSGRRDVFVLLAAGGLISLALQRLTLLVAGGLRHDFMLTPGQRLEITAMGISLGVGIWTISHALRMRVEK